MRGVKIMTEFKPTKTSKNRALFEVALGTCCKCENDMVASPCAGDLTFSLYRKDNFLPQVARGGFCVQSKIKVDGFYICTDCARNGRADFLCAICLSRHPTNKTKESFGNPQEHLCLDCYSSVPAREWDEKCEELEKAHRYDYE